MIINILSVENHHGFLGFRLDIGWISWMISPQKMAGPPETHSPAGRRPNPARDPPQRGPDRPRRPGNPPGLRMASETKGLEVAGTHGKS